MRILGDVTQEGALDLLRKVDDVYISAIRRHGLYDEIWQACASSSLPPHSQNLDSQQHSSFVRDVY